MDREDETAWRQLERFLLDWYGPPARILRETPVPNSLVDALVAWHRLAALWDDPIADQNQVLTPDATWRDDDHVVFYVENQGVWLWALGPETPPRVHERENEPGKAWTATGETLNEFLLHVAKFEAVLGTSIGASVNDVSVDQLATVTSMCEPVRCQPWRYPGPQHSLWQRADSLIFTCANQPMDSPLTGDSTFSVFIAAHDTPNLAFLDSLDISWDWSSRQTP